MLYTGQIAFWKDSGGGQDSDFNPLPASNVISDYIPCNIKQVKKEWKWEVDGDHVQARYSLYFYDNDLPSGVNLENVSEVSLKDNNGYELGKYRVLSREPLSLFNKTKMIVAE